MKKVKFSVPIYGIDVTLVQVEGVEDAAELRAVCEEVGLLEDDTEDVVNNVERDCYDGGDTYRNMQKGKIIVIFYRMSAVWVKKNRYGHEKRHVEDRILQWCRVDDIEAAAYLAGFLSEYFDELYLK